MCQSCRRRLRPHPHFMLFATQNPPGAYGGRKQLSRAFQVPMLLWIPCIHRNLGAVARAVIVSANSKLAES